ncbi:hypothetical protein D9756_008226 [Leucocoprinus leucothites]|uniref:Uncharacterized protein n=1 Tax=Leucocoprinus leucothites TaxID=201217 RepID=A0A8H5D0I3_9AGAR|nr:hypothetical protein D9756_008226 [Leucoagaricus leucothites]
MPVKSRRVQGSTSDPLSLFTTPSESETPEERELRLQQEEEAQQISSAIDEELNRQRKAPKPVKILLLGQSESGKSTTLKNFQLMHTPKTFGRERASWKAVIYLNIVRAFHLIMDTMDRIQRNDYWLEEGEVLKDLPRLTADHLKIKRRLSPLLHVEQSLSNQFCSLKEVAVNSTTQWKESFGRLVKGIQFDSSPGYQDKNDPDDPSHLLHACCEDMIWLWNDSIVREMLYRLKLNMEDHARYFLDSLERITAPQYLPTDGMSSPSMSPSWHLCLTLGPDDILRARLKTLGVSEHQFRVDTGAGIAKDWRIYDVGGHRSQRYALSFKAAGSDVYVPFLFIFIIAAWVPFFDDMDVIIFLAPISAFDQMLEEDPKLNRLMDSFQLWSALVSNELLSHTNIILFLNKFDIFQAKIEAGIPLVNYVTSYRDRPNTVESTSEYLQRKFAALMKSNSKLPRVFYSHFTTVTQILKDTKSTKYVLSNCTYPLRL